MNPSSAPTKPVTPPFLDLTVLPLAETVSLLRSLARTMVLSLLENGPLPDLDMLLAEQDKDRLAQARIWVVPLRRRFAHISSDLKSDLHHCLQAPIRKATSGTFPFRKWWYRAGDAFALALGGTRGDCLPDAFWPLVAKAAWQDPGFRYTVARAIGEYLRHTTIPVPGDQPAVVLQPATFWVLLAISGGEFGPATLGRSLCLPGQ